MRKSQVAMEYLIIVGLVLVIMIPITILYVRYSSETSYAVTASKVDSISNEIAKAANSVYFYGEDTQTSIEVDFPSGISSISFSGNEIVFGIRTEGGGESEIAKVVDVQLTDLAGQGTIPMTPGRKKIIIKSLGDKVAVSIPCELTSKTCILASNLVTNGDFSSDTTGWEAIRATLASVNDGQEGNSLELTATSGDDQRAQQSINTVLGKLYRVTAWVKSGTSGDEAFKITFGTTSIDGTSSSTWTEYTSDITATSTSMNIELDKRTSTLGTMLFDTVSVKVSEFPGCPSYNCVLECKNYIWGVIEDCGAAGKTCDSSTKACI